MTQASSPNRIEWIDEFKGFVLLLVCLYHVEQYFTNANMGMNHLITLRMSAFFFISGVLFSTRRFPHFKDYFVHKTKVLLLPYIFLSLFFLILDPVLYHFEWISRVPPLHVVNFTPHIENTGDYIFWNLANIFYAGNSSIGAGPLWFVFTLYSVSLLFYLIQKICREKKWAVALCAFSCLAGGWFLYKNHIKLPFNIERDVTTLFFFGCGYLCKPAIQKFGQFLAARDCTARDIPARDTTTHNNSRALKIALTAFLALAALSLYAFFEQPDPNFSIWGNTLGKDFLSFFLSSLFGIFGLVFAFLLFSQIPATATPLLRAPLALFHTARGILRNISRNALIILAVHWWILLLFRIIFKAEIDKPQLVYTLIPIVAIGVILAIPLFRCKLYRLLGKEKISLRESLSLK